MNTIPGRRLSAIAVSALLALVGVIAITEPASAADRSSITITLTVLDERHVNARFVIVDPRASKSELQERCEAREFEREINSKSVKVTYDVDDSASTCISTVTGMTFSQFNSHASLGEFRHDDDEIVYDSPTLTSIYDRSSLTIEFPGKVSYVSGNGEKSGKEATWSHPEEEASALRAIGADSAGFPAVAVMIVLLFVVTTAVVTAVVISRRNRHRAALAGAGPLPAPGMVPVGQTPAMPAGPGQPYPFQPGRQGPGDQGQPGYRPGTMPPAGAPGLGSPYQGPGGVGAPPDYELGHTQPVDIHGSGTGQPWSPAGPAPTPPPSAEAPRIHDDQRFRPPSQG